MQSNCSFQYLVIYMDIISFSFGSVYLLYFALFVFFFYLFIYLFLLLKIISIFNFVL